LASADELIRADRCITIDDLVLSLDIIHGSSVDIVSRLGYSKVCAKWVPKQLTNFHKEARVNACSQLLEYHNDDGNFLSRIVTGDETWVHHFEPESKRASLEWRHPYSPRTKKFKTQQSAGKIMATVFWDVSGPILVEFTPKGTTINSDRYIETLKKLKARLKRVRPHLDMSKVLLQHDNARPHTSLKTREAITSLGWTTLVHPPYSPDLAPSDYHLFGPLKEGLRGKHYANDDAVKAAVRKWLRDQPMEFYEAGIQSLIKRWNTTLQKEGDYIEH
jgi:histone-lysine N-methyltransferase SETMAR